VVFTLLHSLACPGNKVAEARQLQTIALGKGFPSSHHLISLGYSIPAFPYRLASTGLVLSNGTGPKKAVS
jgi:hypothetical protein